jgi:hypothetical protein
LPLLVNTGGGISLVKLVPYSSKSHPQYPSQSHDFKKGAKGSVVVDVIDCYANERAAC